MKTIQMLVVIPFIIVIYGSYSTWRLKKYWEEKPGFSCDSKYAPVIL